MSYTTEVKRELIQIKTEQIPELAALVRMNGTIQIKKRRFALKIKFYLADLARKVYTLIKKEYQLEMQIIVRKDNYFDIKHNMYELFLPPQSGLDDFLFQLGLIDENNIIMFKIKDEIINKRSYQRAYIRGAFLGGGSVNNPNSDYHLEFRCEHKGFAGDLMEILLIFDLKGRLTEHNNKYIIYFKNFDEVTTILNIIGAHKALLKMENRHVVKSLKNDVNRKINFETANLDKTIEAAMLQLEDIELIEENKGLKSLPKSLREIAYLRIENPYASLAELGKILTPPLSKSGVNHRMRRIKKIASTIKRNRENI